MVNMGINQAVIRRILTNTMANTDLAFDLIINGISKGTIKDNEWKIKINNKTHSKLIRNCNERR